MRSSTSDIGFRLIRKDPGFDRYGFAVALSRAEELPDDPERWPVRMVRPFEPKRLKDRFRSLALDLLERFTGRDPMEGSGPQENRSQSKL